MKKYITIVGALLVLCTLAMAATYGLIEIKSAATPQAVAGIGVGLTKYVDVTGVTPGNATVTVSRISGTSTSTIATVACTAGKGAAAATANTYLVVGDYVYYTKGHATSTPTVRIVIEE